MDYIIGVDLGGTQLRVILADTAGHVYAEQRWPTEAQLGPMAVIQRMAHCIEQLRQAVPSDGCLLGVGIGSPGPLDPQSGVVFSCPNLPGWYHVPLRDHLQAYVGLPVVLNNDANVAALGEWCFGGGKGFQHLVYITVSTGIGGGVIIDGRLLLGRLGVAAELGHMIIDVAGRRSWEDLASGTALGLAAATAMRVDQATLLHTLATPQTVTAAHVAQAAALQDGLARQLMQHEAELLGLGFVSTLHLFSPQIVLVGGSVITANPFLLDDARQVVQERVIDDLYRSVPIEVAALGDQAGVLGAVALFLYQQ